MIYINTILLLIILIGNIIYYYKHSKAEKYKARIVELFIDTLEHALGRLNNIRSEKDERD